MATRHFASQLLDAMEQGAQCTAYTRPTSLKQPVCVCERVFLGSIIIELEAWAIHCGSYIGEDGGLLAP